MVCCKLGLWVRVRVRPGVLCQPFICSCKLGLRSGLALGLELGLASALVLGLGLGSAQSAGHLGFDYS